MRKQTSLFHSFRALSPNNLTILIRCNSQQACELVFAMSKKESLKTNSSFLCFPLTRFTRFACFSTRQSRYHGLSITLLPEQSTNTQNNGSKEADGIVTGREKWLQKIKFMDSSKDDPQFTCMYQLIINHKCTVCILFKTREYSSSVLHLI